MTDIKGEKQQKWEWQCSWTQVTFGNVREN